jgi:hypothetical protein
MTTVCLAEDDFTQEQSLRHRQAEWRAQLSDGTVVIMDDNRPGVQPASAWLRLARHVQEHNLAICRLWLQFRTHVEQDILPANAEGYYFCKSALGFLTLKDTLHFFLVGYLTNGKIMVQKWCVPELLLLSVETRDPELAGPCLIRNPNVQEKLG